MLSKCVLLCCVMLRVQVKQSVNWTMWQQSATLFQNSSCTAENPLTACTAGRNAKHPHSNSWKHGQLCANVSTVPKSCNIKDLFIFYSFTKGICQFIGKSHFNISEKILLLSVDPRIIRVRKILPIFDPRTIRVRRISCGLGSDRGPVRSPLISDDVTDDRPHGHSI